MPICTKCKTHSTRVSYYNFPADDEIRQKWIDFLKASGQGLRIKKDNKLCSKHFTEDCFTTDNEGKKILKEGSLPSIEVVKKQIEESKKGAYIGLSSKKKCILCGNHSSDLSYFTVPKDEEAKQKWEKFCQFELTNVNYSLCHLHFNPSLWIIENKRRKLLPNALPTVFFDDYQFEFIPVRTSNGVDDIIDPTVIKSNIRTEDYQEYNTPPQTPSEMTIRNGVTDDIVNIFIPSCDEDQTLISEDNSMNNSTLPTSASAELPTSSSEKKSLYVFGPNGRKKRMSYPGDYKSENVDSLEVAKMGLDALREIINKKNRMVRTLSNKVRRLQAKNKTLKETIREMKAESLAKHVEEEEDIFSGKGWWDS